MKITKKQIAIGSAFFLALLTSIETFLIILIGYFLYLSYQNYKDVWKK